MELIGNNYSHISGSVMSVIKTSRSSSLDKYNLHAYPCNTAHNTSQTYIQ